MVEILQNIDSSFFLNANSELFTFLIGMKSILHHEGQFFAPLSLSVLYTVLSGIFYSFHEKSCGGFNLHKILLSYMLMNKETQMQIFNYSC